MESNEIKLTLKTILEQIQKQKKYDIEQLSDTANIRDDLGLDSVDMLDMVWAIEEQFGIAIDNSLFPSMLTIGDVVKTVQSEVAQKNSLASNPA